MKQADTAKYVEKFLRKRGLEIAPARINHWTVFERAGGQIGIDQSAGIWIRGSESEDWRCVCQPCNTSGAILAVEFLCK